MQNKEVAALRDAYARHFPIGAAVSPETLDRHPDLIARQFSSLTAENVMKFEEIHPAEGAYRFEPADKIVKFAEDHRMKLRGHTLVWHNQTPDWVFEGADRSLLIQRLEEHIATVVGRYKGKIHAWDVVNEAITDQGSEPLRDTQWLKIIGKDYISLAFHLARKTDPDAVLFYNDYNTENREKRQKIFNLVKELKESGTPIDAVGLQGHWSVEGPPVEEIENSIVQFASLGVKVQITELDLSFYRENDDEIRYTEPPQELLESQAKRYREIFEMFLRHKDAVTGVTFWGVTDDGSWLNHFPVRHRKNWPLLFDENGEPKSAFRGIVSASESVRK